MCHIRDLIKAIWVQQEGVLMQFPENLMGHCHPDVKVGEWFYHKCLDVWLSLFIVECDVHDVSLAWLKACPWKGNWLKGVNDMFGLWQTR